MFLCATLLACAERDAATARWEHSTNALYAAAVSNDGHYAVVAAENNRASYWDLQANTRLFDWKHDDAAEEPIAHVAIAPDSSHVITADARRFVIWSTRDGHSLGFWQVDAPINAVALSDGARYILLGLSDGRALYIDRLSQRRLEVVAHQGERVTQVDLSGDGMVAATGGNDGRVMIWDAPTGAERYAFEHAGRIAIVKLNRDATQLFAADERGSARIWDLQSGTAAATIKLPQRQTVISAAQFSNDGQRLILGFPGRTVRLWATHSGEQIAQLRTPIRKHGWVPQGSTVYAVGFDDTASTVIAESSNGLGGAWRVATTN